MLARSIQDGLLSFHSPLAQKYCEGKVKSILRRSVKKNLKTTIRKRSFANLRVLITQLNKLFMVEHVAHVRVSLEARGTKRFELTWTLCGQEKSCLCVGSNQRISGTILSARCKRSNLVERGQISKSFVPSWNTVQGVRHDRERIQIHLETRNESELYISTNLLSICQNMIIGSMCWSWSNHVGTRKVMIYTWIGWSQRKLWWKVSGNVDVQIACQSWV